MKSNPLTLLHDVKRQHIWIGAVILATLMTLPIVAIMQWWLEKKVTANFLITGLVASFIVASVISALIIYFLQSLNELRQNNNQLNAIISSCPVPMAISDISGHILNLNPEFVKKFGYTTSDIPTIDDWWLKAFPDENYRQWVIRTWNERLKTFLQNDSEFDPLEIEVRCKDNKDKTVLTTATSLGNNFKDIFLAVLYDLSDKSKMYQAITESRNLLQSVIETIPMRVFWKDRDSHYIGFNSAFLNDTGIASANELIGLDDKSLPWKKDASAYIADDHLVMQTGKTKHFYEEVRISPENHTTVLRKSKVPLRDHNANVIGVLGVYEDITERKNLEKELWITKTIIDKSKTSYFFLSPQGKVIFVNDFACEVLGYSREELTGMYPWQFDPDFPADAWSGVWSDLKKNGIVNIETRHRRKDGSILNVDVTGNYITLNGEEFSFSFVQDITERKKTDAELRIAATAFESQEGMIITDANSNILKINHSFTRITGFTSEEAVGRKMNLLKSGIHDDSFYREMWHSIQSTGSWQGEIWNRRKNGEIYPEWLTITAVKDLHGVVTHYVGTMIDITARKAIEERVHHMAHYDVLTDLPNRTLLTDRLHQAMAVVRREKSKLALIFLDLDKFKPVNDSLGHDIGDLLLKQVAYRLQHCVKRESDTLSRIGGDEFVIVLSQIEDEHDASVVADKIVQTLTEPFMIENNTIEISCSVGIAIYPMHGTDVTTLMRIADNAMYEAKRAGRGCFRFYTSDSPQNPHPTESSPDNLI